MLRHVAIYVKKKVEINAFNSAWIHTIIHTVLGQSTDRVCNNLIIAICMVCLKA